MMTIETEISLTKLLYDEAILLRYLVKACPNVNDVHQYGIRAQIEYLKYCVITLGKALQECDLKVSASPEDVFMKSRLEIVQGEVTVQDCMFGHVFLLDVLSHDITTVGNQTVIEAMHELITFHRLGISILKGMC